MISVSTVEQAMTCLRNLKDSGYKYCRVLVDNYNIGAALVEDIIDAIDYCRSPRGKIRAFVFHGKEYVVKSKIEIKPMTNDDFMLHIMGVENPYDTKLMTTDLQQRLKQADFVKSIWRTTDEVDAEEWEKRKERWRQIRDSELCTKIEKPKGPSPIPKEVSSRNERRNVGDVEGREKERILSNSSKKPKGFFAKIAGWFKGDVGYKR